MNRSQLVVAIFLVIFLGGRISLLGMIVLFSSGKFSLTCCTLILTHWLHFKPFFSMSSFQAFWFLSFIVGNVFHYLWGSSSILFLYVSGESQSLVSRCLSSGWLLSCFPPVLCCNLFAIISLSASPHSVCLGNRLNSLPVKQLLSDVSQLLSSFVRAKAWWRVCVVVCLYSQGHVSDILTVAVPSCVWWLCLFSCHSHR